MKKEYQNNPDYNPAGERFYMFGEKNSTNRTLDRAFAISNEQLPDIFGELNLKGKKMATVGSSGDQTFNAILQGCTDITIIDGNPYARAFMEYKLAMIKTFNFEKFNDLFVKPKMFNWRVYAKISHHLSPNAQIFWDSLMLELNEPEAHAFPSEKSVTNRMLIIDHTTRHSLFYTDAKTYNQLQNTLNNTNINFKYINAEFKEFPEALKEKFDLIYLSNVYFYIDPEEFNVIANKLYNYRLKSGGKMVVNYEFNTHDSKDHESPKTMGNLPIETKNVTRNSFREICTDTVWIINKPKSKTKESVNIEPSK